MRHLVVGLMLLWAVANFAGASAPGELIDCSDWIFLDPRLSCKEIACGPTGEWCFDGQKMATGNGYLYRFKQSTISLPCLPATGFRVELITFDGITEDVIAYVESRCGLNDIVDGISTAAVFGTPGPTMYDYDVGRMYHALQSHHFNGITYFDLYFWQIKINGF